MRLSIVRESLEDRELANYTPMLSQGVSVRVITSRRAGPYASTGLGTPMRRLRQRADFFGPAAVSRRVAREFSNLVDLEQMVGLPDALEGTDVVCVNETHLASSAQVCRLRQANQNFRVAVVCYENIPFRYEDDPLLARRKDVVRRAADHFIALTPQALRALEMEGIASERVSLQPYGVDARRFSHDLRDNGLRASWGARGDECVVLFAGRLIQEKGLANLVEAAAGLRDEAFRVVFVGSGSEKSRLERIVAKLGIGARVTFAPWSDSTEIPRVMASADVFAMPSLPTPYWEEQLGFSLIEAMASSVPVLSTRSGSIPFVVGAGGLLVDAYDVPGLGDALAALVSDPGRRAELGAAGRTRVETDLNTLTAASRLRQIMDDTAR